MALVVTGEPAKKRAPKTAAELIDEQRTDLILKRALAKKNSSTLSIEVRQGQITVNSVEVQQLTDRAILLDIDCANKYYDVQAYYSTTEGCLVDEVSADRAGLPPPIPTTSTNVILIRLYPTQRTRGHIDASAPDTKVTIRSPLFVGRWHAVEDFRGRYGASVLAVKLAEPEDFEALNWKRERSSESVAIEKKITPRENNGKVNP